MQFRSLKEEIYFHLETLLQDCREHSRTEALAYVRERVEREVTYQSFSNVFSSFMHSPGYSSPHRGYIRLNTVSEHSSPEAIQTRAITILEEGCHALDSIFTINLMALSEDITPLVEVVKAARQLLYEQAEIIRKLSFEDKPHASDS